MNGLFIVLEGPEGAGKSTLALRLADWLRERAAGRAAEVILTREPGGTPVSDAIRTVLLDPGQKIAPLTEFLLYSASRSQHVEDVIRPALEAGGVVICDRFTASSVAYQGAGRGLDQKFVADLNARVSNGCHPDLTILLDIDPDRGLERIRERGAADRLEQAESGFHHRVAESFRTQAVAKDWLTIDADLPEAEVAATAKAALEGLLEQWLAG